MKKIICSIIALLTVCYTLCGCYGIETTEIDVNRFGKGKIYCIAECDESALDAAGIKKLNGPWSEFKEKKTDGKKYYQATYELKVNSWEDLEEKLKEISYGMNGSIKIFSDVSVTPECIKLKTNSADPPAEADEVDLDMIDSVCDFVLVFNMPFKITEHNVGKLSENGKTLTVTIYNPSKEVDIELKFDAEPMWMFVLKIVLIALAVLIPIGLLTVAIIAVLIIVIKKKKSTAPCEETNQINDEERNKENEDKQP